MTLCSTLYEEAAKADGAVIIKRMEVYTRGTWLPQSEKRPFTDRYKASEPVLNHYPGGVVLTIACKLIPEGRRNPCNLMGGAAYGPGDVLFLAPDPSVYVKE